MEKRRDASVMMKAVKEEDLKEEFQKKVLWM